MADNEKHNPNTSRNWGVAGITASFIFSFLFSQYGEQLLGRLYPVFTYIWPMVLVALGVFAGWQLKKWRVSVMLNNIDTEAIKAAAVEKEKQAGEIERQKILLEKEKREKQEKEEKKALELEQSKIDFIMTLEFESKKILLEILENGQIKRPSLSRGWEGDAGFASWVKYEPIANGMDRWSLNPWAKEFLDEHPELLECVRVEREAREKVEKSIKENGYQRTLQEVGKNIEWNDDGTMKL